MSRTVKRILCYGDSLTAGFCRGGSKYYPYASYLKEKLMESLENVDVEVDHHGFCGLTTKQLLDNSCAESFRDVNRIPGPGIVSALNLKEYDLVILMAGTNDLLHGEPISVISSNLKKLSQLVLSKTMLLTIGIPDSSYFSLDKKAKETREEINQMLSNQKEVGLKYVDCPLKFSSNTTDFDSDGLHFSESGSDKFASGILKSVSSILFTKEK